MDHKNESPDADKSTNRAKSSFEATKLLQKYATETATGATHFWCRHSNSVQPMAFMMAEGWA